MTCPVRPWAKFVPSFLLLCSLAVLFAAGPKAPPAKPAPKPVVVKGPKITVTKTDAGKAVSGELVEATPAGVTLRPAAPGGAAPVTLAWADIKSVSNGLTRQKVVDDWKVSHADRLCPDCVGEGTTKCDACHGTGVDPAQAKPCDKCKGSGDLGKCPKCTDGKVPCPAPCIKESDYTSGKTGADGSRQGRIFRMKDGRTWYFHDTHIGQMPVMEDGVWVAKEKCPTCNGTSKVICPTCHGTAKRECPACHGAGVIGPACTAACKAGLVECNTCGGTGLKAQGAGQPAAPTGDAPAAPGSSPPPGAAADKP